MYISMDGVGVMIVDPYLIINLLSNQSPLSYHEEQGSTGHKDPMTQVPKHDGKQEGEGDDSVWCWRRGGRHHVRGGRRGR